MLKAAGTAVGLALAAVVVAGPALPEEARATVAICVAVALGAVLAAELRTNWHLIASRLGFGARRAPPHYVRALFADYADRFDAHLLERLRYRAPNRVQAALAGALEAPAAAALDLGCGTGLCGPLLAPLAGRLVGVDLSPEMLAVAGQRGCYDALVEADLLDWLATPPERFDLCAAADVLVYFGDLAPVFAGVARALRPGGLFAFTTEAAAGGGWRLTRTGRFRHAPAHVRRMAGTAGFAVLVQSRETLRTESDNPVAGDLWLLRRL